MRLALDRVILAAALWLAGASAVAADPAFQGWLQALWPEAQRIGVSRSVFDEATRGLEPDLSLPDLVIPGRPQRPDRGQPEFVQPPSVYLSEKSIAGLAARGRKLAAEHRATLAAVEQRFGVPAQVVLAIWGRESAYGGQKLPHNAVRVLATQAYLGRRKEQFREEFLLALKILQDGDVTLVGMRSSWAGAMGQTQMLPGEFYRTAVDFDGNGRRDIWNSIPDALASTARQLAEKGWQRGQRWAYEVRAPANADCTLGDPDRKMPIGEWLARGFVPAYDRKLNARELAESASLLMPEGAYGPAFLITGNYFVLKDYNFSDLYVLFVGHLADRIGDPRPFETPWQKVAQLQTGQVEAMQRRMTELGLYADKIDGKAGMKTRLALGAYQKANGLALDCWPTAAVLDHMRAGAAR